MRKSKKKTKKNIISTLPFMKKTRKKQKKYIFSTFKNHFVQIKNKVKTKILNSSTYKTNAYFLPSFIEYILVHYMPYAPLWTGLLLKPSLQTRLI